MTVVVSLKTTEGIKKKTFETFYHPVNWIQSYDPKTIKSVSVSFKDEGTTKSGNFDMAYKAISWLNLHDEDEQKKKNKI